MISMHSLFVLLCVFNFALIMYLLSFFFRHLLPGCFGLARFLVVVGWLFTLCDTHTAWCYWLAVISPELVMEVEARMNRQYTPPNLHPAGTIPVTVPRSKAYPRPKKPSGLPTVQENNSRGKFPLDLEFTSFEHCIRFYCAWNDLLVTGKVALSICIKKIVWSYS